MTDFEVFHGTVRDRFAREIDEYVRSLPADTPPFIAARQWLDTHEDDEAYDLFVEWLLDRELALLAEQIKNRLPKPPSAKASRASAFALAVDGFVSGDIDALTDFRLVYKIDGTEKPLGEMTGADHQWASSAFQSIGSNALMLAAIHRQVARVLGDRKTSEAFSEASYRRLFGVRSDEDPLAELLTG